MKRSLPFVAAALVLAACGDSPAEPTAVAPKASAPARSVAATADVQRMAVIGGELVDATDAFLVVLDDESRADLAARISTLAAALTAGDAAGAATALAAARERLAAIPGDAAATELAPVGLALDAVEAVLQGAA
jgi:hypothetical protein